MVLCLTNEKKHVNSNQILSEQMIKIKFILIEFAFPMYAFN